MNILHRLLCAALLAGVADSFAAESQTVASFERTVTKKLGYTYLLGLPTGYDAAAGKEWPLIVFLHGSGESGSEPWLVAKHGPPKLLRGDVPVPPPPPGKQPPPPETPEARAKRHECAAILAANFIVVSPQCPSARRGWDDESVLLLVDEICAKYKVDPRRIYLTGLSMGGYGTWSVGMKNVSRFAAIVPICGGGTKADVRRAARDHKDAFMNLGVWVFHGAKDPTVPLEESEAMVAELKKAGATDVQLTVYPEAKHDSWTEAYNSPELYAWLLKHAR
jgi:predicted peptidase